MERRYIIRGISRANARTIIVLEADRVWSNLRLSIRSAGNYYDCWLVRLIQMRKVSFRIPSRRPMDSTLHQVSIGGRTEPTHRVDRYTPGEGTIGHRNVGLDGGLVPPCAVLANPRADICKVSRNANRLLGTTLGNTARAIADNRILTRLFGLGSILSARNKSATSRVPYVKQCQEETSSMVEACYSRVRNREEENKGVSLDWTVKSCI
ncbi:hypothetical protein F4777DRAFT_344532 [Nemania sp. FL0916]|nr:hypothetical protein F4777DRAFT_344532 [Nemania sp. FL0916]